MIAKRIDAGKDSQGNKRHHHFGKLGNYIRDASHDGEKCLIFWHEGCLAPDYDLALVEIEATQAMNSRCKNDKTYHLMVSFRPEDEARLTSAVLQQIEHAMAEALDLSEHQRLCGVHRNTNNLHLHVAYNLIHPEKLTMATTLHYDFHKLSKACRAMEKEFGLEIDNGIEVNDQQEPKISQQAAAMEAHSGEQSFQSFVLAQRNHILAQVQAAKNWPEVHQVLAGYSIAVQPKANGFVLTNTQGKGSIKASAVGKDLSRMRMEARFGMLVWPGATGNRQAENDKFDQSKSAKGQSYKKRPCQPRNPERDQLYKEYQAALAEKVARIEEEKARCAASHDWLKDKWQRMKADLCATTSSRRTRAVRMRMMLNLHRQDVSLEKADHKKAMEAIRRDYPWYNWNGYLQQLALQDNTVALGVLRSQEERKTAQAAIKNPALEKTLLNVAFEDKAAVKEAGAKWDRQEKRWYALKGSDLDKFITWLPAQPGAGLTGGEGRKSDKRKNTTQTLDAPKDKKTPGRRLAYLVWQEQERLKDGSIQKSFFSGYSHRIDNRGMVIITLASGGTIRDTGRKLYFSLDEDSRQAARLYAMAKFGKHFTEKENCMEMKGNGKWRAIEPHLGFLRECARNGLRTLSQLPVVPGRKQPEVFLQGNARNDMER